MHEVSLYQRILESNLINFIIMISILTFIFKKAKLGLIIDKMADEVKNTVSNSVQAARNAVFEYKNIKKSLKNTEDEKQNIIANAKNTAKNMEESLRSSIQNEENLLDEKCARKIQNDIKKTEDAAVFEIFDIVRILAEDEIKRLIFEDKDGVLQNRLIEKAIDEIDNIDLEGVKI